MKIPSGLIDNAVEVFRYTCDGRRCTKALMNGTTVRYLELPGVLREPFQADMIRDKKAMKCIREDFGIHDLDLMEECFVGCRYGALDNAPDLKDNKLICDAPVCDRIKDCPGFNIVCKVPPGPAGTLSRHEFLVAQMVGAGKLDKEIATEMGIEITTVRTHMGRIREKLCFNNRVEIAMWAQNKGIV